MSSTLRSLVLRYKADTKDFAKGTAAVKADIKSVNDNLAGVNKAMAAAFAGPAASKIDTLRGHIKTLNAEFSAGRLKAHEYGNAVDQIKQKIGKLQIGADLRSNYRGSMVESGDQIRARMSGANDPLLAGGPRGSGVADFMAMKKWGLAGKLLGVAGPAAGIGGIVHGVSGRLGELGSGGQSDTLGGFGSTVGNVAKGTIAIAGQVKQGFLDGLAGLVGGVANAATFGAVGQFGREVSRQEEWIANNNRISEFGAARGKLIESAGSPLRDFAEARRLGKMDEFALGKDLAATTKARDQAQALEEIARLNNKIQATEAAIVSEKQKAIALDEQRAAAMEAFRGANHQVINDMERQLDIEKLVDGGLSRAAATLKRNGGTAEDVASAQRIQSELDDIERRRLPSQGNTFQPVIDAVSKSFQAAMQQAQKVAQFSAQFDTPQEAFKRNVDELGRLSAMGLSPEVAERALKKYAHDTAGMMGDTSRLAPSATKGSFAEAQLANAAKGQLQKDAKADELIKIGKAQLDELKKESGNKITVVEVTL